MYKRCIKRVLGFVLALGGTIVSAPFMLVFALLVKADSKGPVLFKQKRVGKDKKYFNILKFRTMYADTPADVPTHLMVNPNSRITKMGSFLRKYSLDELPQMYNILAGQMSVVGPRPALWNQHDLIEERDKYGANALVPGLTGWAQINGRDELPIDVKAKLDGYYAQNIGFVLDVKIFFRTILNVFTARGVVEGGEKNAAGKQAAGDAADAADGCDTPQSP